MPPKRAGTSRALLVSCALAATLLPTLLGAWTFFAPKRAEAADLSSLASPPSPPSVPVPLIYDPSKVFITCARAIRPAVAHIMVTRIVDGKDEEMGHGSGLILDPHGLILTNAHVVKDSNRVAVRLEDGRIFAADIEDSDEEQDLATLQIEGHDLPYALLGDSDTLEPGEWVMAIGSPYGLDYTVTVGVVSAMHRNDFARFGKDLIQTDAALNPGNSGGPLINLSGRVVGINSAICSQTGGNQGIGFSIPINQVRVFLGRCVRH